MLTPVTAGSSLVFNPEAPLHASIDVRFNL